MIAKLNAVRISALLALAGLSLGIQLNKRVEILETYDGDETNLVEIYILSSQGQEESFTIVCRYDNSLSPKSIFLWQWMPRNRIHQKAMVLPVAGVDMDDSEEEWTTSENIRVQRSLGDSYNWSHISFEVTSPTDEQFGRYRCQLEQKMANGSFHTMVSRELAVWATFQKDPP